MTEKKKRIISNVLSLALGIMLGIGGTKFAANLGQPAAPITINVPTPEEFDLRVTESQGMKLTAVKLMSSEYEANGVSAQSESAYTLTATITPADAANKAVDWSVSFANPSSAWASGKTVTNYVTITPSSSGALTATARCLKDFGEKIKITVQSRAVPEIKAECICEYSQKVSALSYYILGDNNMLEYTLNSANSVTKLGIELDEDIMQNEVDGKTHILTGSAYTTKPLGNVVLNHKLGIYADIWNQFKATLTGTKFAAAEYINEDEDALNFSSLFFYGSNSEFMGLLKSWLSSHSTTPMFYIKVENSSKSVSFTFPVTFEASVLAKTVSSVSLDQSQLEF